MNVAVVDCNYADQRFRGMAATWLEWQIRQFGAYCKLTDPAQADVLLLTASSPEGTPQVRTAIKNHWNRRAKRYLGGGIASSPATVQGVVDGVCVGEGVNFVRTLCMKGPDAAERLPECWCAADKRPVIPSEEFPWDVPPIKHPDGTIRLFAARGCRGKCLFCQTGWEQRYQCNPDPDRLRSVARGLVSAGQKVALVTNDGTEPWMVQTAAQEFVSVRLRSLRAIWPVDRRQIKSVRIGVEGVSERLRAAVKKPFTTAELLDRSVQLLGNGVGVRWFFIVGLPGETAADWQDLQRAIRELAKLPKGVVMMNFHAFMPQPATPLGVLPLRDEYWDVFQEFRRWFFHGPGFTRRVQLVAPAQYETRMKNTCLKMTCTEAEARAGWFAKCNPNWRVRRVITPEQMRTIAIKYARRVGFAI